MLSIVRDLARPFPPDWPSDQPLPNQQPESELKAIVEGRTSDLQEIADGLKFILEYERRYYENDRGQCYHRPCGGGAMKEGDNGIWCSRCGKLPDLLPPKCFQ